jgi:hypothetical protein
VRDLQKQLHMQENATPLVDPPASNGRPFDGKVDQTILRLETSGKDLIAKATLTSFISDLFADANVDCSKYEIKGDDADSRFVIKFKGGAGVAARNVGQARLALRESSGKYKELSIAKPAGGNTRIFINPDKNPRMQKMEYETKRMGKIFQELYSGTKWHLNRIDGEIANHKWTPILKLEVGQGEIPTKIRWNLAALAETAIVKEDVVSKFTSTSREKVQINWSL